MFSHDFVEPAPQKHPALHLPLHAGVVNPGVAPYVPPGQAADFSICEAAGHQNPIAHKPALLSANPS
jgi:hypothetical protein